MSDNFSWACPPYVLHTQNLNVQAHELALNLSIHSLGRSDAVNASKRARDAEGVGSPLDRAATHALS